MQWSSKYNICLQNVVKWESKVAINGNIQVKCKYLGILGYLSTVLEQIYLVRFCISRQATPDCLIEFQSQILDRKSVV